MEIRARVESALRRLELNYSSEAPEKLSEFISILIKWNDTHKLVGKTDLSFLIDYLLVDSLLPLKFLEIIDKDCFDIGSGNGFPGIALAIAGHPRSMYLIEKKKKKASFLKFVAANLGLESIKVVNQRFEEVEKSMFFDLGFSKALARPKAVWELANTALKSGGTMVVWAGSKPEKELDKLNAENIKEIIVEKYYFQELKKTTSLIMIVKKEKV